MGKSRLTDISDHLKAAGFDVYFPGQHQGDCKRAYVVVKDDGAGQAYQTSSNFQYYQVMVYVPRQHYTDLEPYADRVRQSMRGLFPMIVPTNTETASFYDDTVEAHMKSIQYRNARFAAR